MSFDPDKYLASTPSNPPAFDPDAYLRAVSGGIPGPRKTGTVVDQIPGYDGPVPAATKPVSTAPTTAMGAIRGGLETGAALASGAITAPIIQGAEILGTLTSGKFGTPQGLRAGEQFAQRVANQIQYRPRTAEGQQYTEAVGNALARTGLQGVPLNVMGDLQRSMGPALRAGGDFVRAEGNLVGDAIKQPFAQRAARIAEERSAKAWERAPQIEAAQAAQRLGIVLNPAESNPTTKTRMIVGATGDAVVNAKAAKVNATRWNDIAREDLGLPKNTPLTPEAFEKARSSHSAPYEEVRKLGTLAPDGDVVQSLDKLKIDPLSTSTPEKAAKVNAIVERTKEQIASGLNGDNVVGQIRGFRKDATRVLNNPNASPIDIATAEANLGIANALENLIEANLNNPKLLGDFRKARTAIAKTYDWERATGITTKQVDPQAVVKLAENGKPLTGALADVATIAGNYPEIATLSTSPGPQMYQMLRRGGVGGTAGFALGGGPVGAAVGAGLTSLGSELTANLLTRRGVQNRLAQPIDYRIPLPGTGPAPMAPPIPQSRAIVPYDYSQQTFVPPNFTIVPNQYGPKVGPAPTPSGILRGLPQPTAEGTMGALRTEDARRAAMSRTLGQQAEQQQATAEAAARRPASGELILDIDPITGKLVESSKGVKGATPETFSNFGSALKTASEKVTSGKPFDLTAAEKVAWEKTRVDLAEIVPGFKALSDKAISAKMMDREWIADTVAKARAQAQAFEQIAARAADERARQAALMKREKMMDLAEQMENSLSTPRPVNLGGQGPKTRAFQRNRLAGKNQNALNND